MDNIVNYTFPSKMGLLLSTEPHPNGNMLGATSQYIFLTSDLLFGLSLEMRVPYFMGISACEKPLGAYFRGPDSTDNTSVDDYLEICLLPLAAQRCLSNARRSLGFIDVNFPKVSFSQFMFRFQGFWQHMKISAGACVWPLGRVIWAVSIVMAARQPFSNQDSWIESHLMILLKERRGWHSFIGDLAVSYWRKKKGNMTTAQIMADYCKIPDHPLVRAWEPYK